MKLVASMPVHNERGRYLEAAIPHLLDYCDEVRVLDDYSDDGSGEWLADQDGVEVKQNARASWREHEGEMRQALLDWTLEGKPTHVLAIDADEFVPRGRRLRQLLEANPGQLAFSLRMVEVWDRSGNPWRIRADGGWRPHHATICYRAPRSRELRTRQREWSMRRRKLAGGRVPHIVGNAAQRGRSLRTRLDIVHLGWSLPVERKVRAARYEELDGGRYHAGDHLASMLAPDPDCELRSYPPQLELPA